MIGSEEEIAGNLVLTSHTLEFVDRTGHTLDTVRLSGRCAGVIATEPDRCITLSDDGDLHVWNATGDVQCTSKVLADGRVSTVAAVPGGGRIAVGGEHGDLRVIELTAALPTPEPDDPRAEQAGELIVDTQGRWAATTMPSRDVAVWDLADGSLRHVFRGHITGVFRNSETNRLAHGHDEHGQWLAHADDDGTLRVRNPISGSRIAIGAGQGGEFLGGAGVRGLAVAERDGRVRLRDPRSGLVAAELVGHTDPVHDVAATTTGLLVTAAADGVRIWDVTRPATHYPPTGRPPAGPSTRVRVDPRGRWLAIIGLRSVRLQELTGRLIVEVDLCFPSTVDTVAPDGARMLVGGVDGTLTVCTPATGAVTTLSPAGPVAITACAVAPGGALTATGNDRGVLTLWDLDKQEAVTHVEVGGVITRCCWVSPNRVLTGGTTGLNLFEVQ
jgi:WD40 repeat protein